LPHTPLTTQNCTTLQPSTSTHTLTLTQLHINTYKNTYAQKPCTMYFFASWFHNLAIRELLFLFSLWNIIRVLYIMSISVYVYMYYCCCFRYLNGVCPIRDGHCGHHQHAPAQWFPLCGRVMMMVTTTSSSSFVPKLLYCFLSVTKDCIRLNCRRYCCQQFSTIADG
jgi:hypothetical protein